MASMEALYATLQDEIEAFKDHIRSCQQVFDLHTLYNVLLLLSGDGGKRDIQSLEQLERLVESQEWDEQDVVRITTGDNKCDISSYVSWFLSYVKYLGSLKEVFDTKVVFPLCENLYVNDDLRALPLGRREGHGLNATPSIAYTAKQLFSLRRKWALLLKGGIIDEQIFSPQSWLDLQGFANIHHFVKVMRLVPDLFHKSLANAKLARQWVELHANRPSPHPVHSNSVSTRKCHNIGLAVGSLQNLWYKVPLSQPGLSKSPHDWLRALQQSHASSSSSNDGDTHVRTTSQEKTKLYEIHRELMSLLWQEERSWTLEAEIQEVNQRISKLQLQWEDKGRELEAFEHQLEKDNWTVLDMKRQAALRELDTFWRQLRLEEYRKSILQSDWLLELELQERYEELARMLQGRKEVPQDLPQSATETDWHSSHSFGSLCSNPKE